MKALWLALLISIVLLQAGCKAASPKSTEQLVIKHLSAVYAQPIGGLWTDGIVYFLPDEPEVELLKENQPETERQGLRVYKAAVWMLHWSPEKFPVLAWVIDKKGGPQVGVAEGAEEIATKFPNALKELVEV